MQYDPVLAAGARPRRRWRRALAGALVAAIALTACTQDGGGEAAPTPTDADGAAGATAPTGDATASPGSGVELEGAQDVGEAVEQGRFTVTVDGFDCDAGDEVESLEPSGRFCILTLELTNDTDTAQAVEPVQQVVLDEAGTEYGYSSEATQAAAEGENPEVEPGETVTVRLVFDIPEEVSIVAARISDSPDDEGTLVRLEQ